ncbi:myb-like protein X [Zeugodacus cucurbitae]|uniref:myb-like protein X n=1 Tax=Zeugodacus cucurbitae TaxID=28588 RepID=UPI0023D8EAEF|nr:myb-like protein X [Zeugodacus cucurbitae]
MKLKIALIALLSVSAISALSLEGFKCREHNVMTGDLMRPVRTVRICGVEDYVEPPSFLDFKKITEIADELQAHKNHATNSYGNTGYWPNRDASHSTPPAYARWPLLPQTTNNDGVQFSTIYRGLAVQPPTYEAAGNYPTNSRDLTVVERLLQEKLRSLTADTSEMKNSMNDVVAHMKTILTTSLMQKDNQPQDINVNVNFKLDPALEVLLRDFMALLKSDVNRDAESAESSATERIEDNSEGDDSSFSTVNVNDNSAEEQVTEAAVDSAEQTTEPDSMEGYNFNGSEEDLDDWLRLHFGPIVKTPTYDEDTDDSESKNSAEKSEESFESWFNAVYRKHTTETPTDKQTQNSQESQEMNVQKESVENSQENDNQYEYTEYIDADMNPVVYNEETTISEETTESSEEALFVPTTMNSLQSSETVELFENGDKYNYATGIPEKLAAQQKRECMDRAYLTYWNDSELLRKNLLKCHSLEQVSLGIEESKENDETDAAVTDSNESKSSEETETPINDSNESKSSAETETPINDSNESKSSAETETPINDSNESKSSAETEATITESNESKSSEETETPINELEDSSEIEYFDYPSYRLHDWNNYNDHIFDRAIIN